MSRAAVRDAVKSWLEGGNITGLTAVHRAPPRWMDGNEWQLSSTLGASAVAAVHINEEQATRISVPAPTVLMPGGPVGQKMRSYRIGLMIFYQYLIPSGGLVAQAEDGWAAQFDTIIDGIVDRLESDPLIGTDGSVVWQAAQEPGDPKVLTDIPRELPGKVLAWGVVEFTVDQVITA